MFGTRRVPVLFSPRAAAADAYLTNGYSPDLVLDFAEEYYRVGGSDSTHAAALTSARSGLATMVDSDGVLKWLPHNFVPSSENPAAWDRSQVGVPTTGQTDSANGTTAGLFTVAAAADNVVWFNPSSVAASPNGLTFTVEVDLKAGTAIWMAIELWNGTGTTAATVWVNVATGTKGSTGTATNAWTHVESSVTPVPNGYYRVRIKATAGPTATNTFGAIRVVDGDGAYNFSAVAGLTYYAAFASMYRSDLGGMVDNPDRGDSYVPTTSAARYLARRGNHIYSGGQWVNAGVQVETEARTNLLHTTGAMPTQSVTTTAQTYTLHFTGTGTVTLSGTSTAGPLVGTGTGENNRVSLTFTPSAGTLTLTVSGTVTNAQLEAGSTPSSYIPNVAASGTVTRSADTLTIPSANLPYSATNMSIVMKGTMTYADTNSSTNARLYLWSADGSNNIGNVLRTNIGTGGYFVTQVASGVTDIATTGGSVVSPGVNVPIAVATRHGTTFVNVASDGTVGTADLTPTSLPDLSSTNLSLGSIFMGNLELFMMFDEDIGDTGIEEATA